MCTRIEIGRDSQEPWLRRLIVERRLPPSSRRASGIILLVLEKASTLHFHRHYLFQFPSSIRLRPDHHSLLPHTRSILIFQPVALQLAIDLHTYHRLKEEQPQIKGPADIGHQNGREFLHSFQLGQCMPGQSYTHQAGIAPFSVLACRLLIALLAELRGLRPSEPICTTRRSKSIQSSWRR